MKSLDLNLNAMFVYLRTSHLNSNQGILKHVLIEITAQGEYKFMMRYVTLVAPRLTERYRSGRGVLYYSSPPFRIFVLVVVSLSVRLPVCFDVYVRGCCVVK